MLFSIDGPVTTASAASGDSRRRSSFRTRRRSTARPDRRAGTGVQQRPRVAERMLHSAKSRSRFERISSWATGGVSDGRPSQPAERVGLFEGAQQAGRPARRRDLGAAAHRQQAGRAGTDDRDLASHAGPRCWRRGVAGRRSAEEAHAGDATVVLRTADSPFKRDPAAGNARRPRRSTPGRRARCGIAASTCLAGDGAAGPGARLRRIGERRLRTSGAADLRSPTVRCPRFVRLHRCGVPYSHPPYQPAAAAHTGCPHGTP